jgi:hypothetical protein
MAGFYDQLILSDFRKLPLGRSLRLPGHSLQGSFRFFRQTGGRLPAQVVVSARRLSFLSCSFMLHQFRSQKLLPQLGG